MYVRTSIHTNCALCVRSTSAGDEARFHNEPNISSLHFFANSAKNTFRIQRKRRLVVFLLVALASVTSTTTTSIQFIIHSFGIFLQRLFKSTTTQHRSPPS